VAGLDLDTCSTRRVNSVWKREAVVFWMPMAARLPAEILAEINGTQWVGPWSRSPYVSVRPRRHPARRGRDQTNGTQACFPRPSFLPAQDAIEPYSSESGEASAWIGPAGAPTSPSRPCELPCESLRGPRCVVTAHPAAHSGNQRPKPRWSRCGRRAYDHPAVMAGEIRISTRAQVT